MGNEKSETSAASPLQSLVSGPAQFDGCDEYLTLDEFRRWNFCMKQWEVSYIYNHSKWALWFKAWIWLRTKMAH